MSAQAQKHHLKYMKGSKKYPKTIDPALPPARIFGFLLFLRSSGEASFVTPHFFCAKILAP